MSFLKKNISSITTFICACLIVIIENFFQLNIKYTQVIQSFLLIVNSIFIYFIDNRCSILFKVKTKIEEFNNMQNVKLSLKGNEVAPLSIILSGENIKKKDKHIFIKFPDEITVTPVSKQMFQYFCKNEKDEDYIKIPINIFKNSQCEFKFIIKVEEKSSSMNSFQNKTIEIFTDFKLPIKLKKDTLLIDWEEDRREQ